MPNFLMILEVSQKQAYIFGSRKLKDNLRCSEEIRYVTSPEFFRACAPQYYRDEENMVYTGGGHTVLAFETEKQAKDFAGAVSEAVLRQFPDMEMFIRTLPYAPDKTPGENLTDLSAALEQKKSFRKASFRRISFGVEQSPWGAESSGSDFTDAATAPEGWTLTTDGEVLAGNDNFLAVVHVDGNSMGKRVRGIYDSQEANDWEGCVSRLRTFSQAIDRDFADAYNEMVSDLTSALDPEDYKGKNGLPVLPVRKVIGAGDDVCFITQGALGIECAAMFLRRLASKRNAEDNLPYAACAGVVLIHRKYPFRVAYDLSEALCSNAKSFGAAYDPNGGISAIDWHIEFGQLKGSLSEIRADYETDDGCRLELRPLMVIRSEMRDPECTEVPEARSYAYFRHVLEELKRKEGDYPRTKVKRLRTAFTQGELESALAVRSMNMQGLLYVGVEARDANAIRKTLAGETVEKSVFLRVDPDDSTKRCMYFDAIEIMDHFTTVGE